MAQDPNKFIKNLDGRQHSDILYVEIDAAQFIANNNVVEVEVPDNCEVIRGFLNVTTAFNAATTDTIKVGDSVNDARYIAATDVKATGLKPMVPTGYIHGIGLTPQKLRITRVATGAAATAGTVRVFIETVALNKAYHTQG